MHEKVLLQGSSSFDIVHEIFFDTWSSSNYSFLKIEYVYDVWPESHDNQGRAQGIIWLIDQAIFPIFERLGLQLQGLQSY